jgi:NAD(P) transhydrogenase subunit alpha
MRIGIPTETCPGETRVAATPETVKKLTSGGRHVVTVQSGAGVRASIPDEAFTAAGATVVPSAAEATGAVDIVLKVRRPSPSEIDALRPVVGLLVPHEADGLAALAARGLTAFALERVPRITRAQAMDVLSSQANIAGYKAVLLAANAYGRFMPMLMTAAGTVKAARVLVLGAGVAGLQAIATAKRLGVESLGAKFVEVPVSDEERAQAQTAGGYARQMSDDYQRRQAALIDERARNADIVITTALIPGRPAPVLLREETLAGMKPGSVVVDLAVEQGGNCPLTERDAQVVKHGVTLIGHSNLPAMLAADASALYARNVFNFVCLLADPSTGALTLNREDEILAGALVVLDGAVVQPEAPR